MIRVLVPLINLIAAAVHFAVGVHVFTLDWKSAPNRIFGVLAILFAYWALASGVYTAAPTLQFAETAYLAAAPSWIGVPLVFFAFCIRFTGAGRPKRLASAFRAVEVSVAALVVVFVIRVMTGPLTAGSHVPTTLGWAEIPSGGAWEAAFTVYYLLCPLAGLFILSRWARREGGIAGKQARIIIGSGIAAMVLLLAAERALPLLGMRIPPLGPVALTVWTLGIAYSILRYRFFALSPSSAAADIVRSMSEMLLLVASDGTVRVANKAAVRLLGYAAETEITGRQIVDIFPDAPAVASLFSPEGSAEPWLMREFSCRKRDGSPMTLSASSVVLRDLDGDRAGIGLIMRDVTGERTALEQLQHMATHDPLTGLPNRAMLRETLAKSLARARRENKSVGVLFIDVDHFKQVNDSLGHQQGDDLLLEVARRMEALLRESDAVGRLGGDEFLIILTDMSSPGDAGLVADRVIAALSRPIVLSGGELHVTCSIGISASPGDGDAVEALLKNADIAMYRAKEKRNGFAFYTAPLHDALMRRLAMEDGLRHAVEKEELELLYQPFFDLESRSVTGVEALLRWNHADFGPLSAMEFLPLAEKIGLGSRIGDWVLRSACACNSRWQLGGLPKIPVSVNVPAGQLLRADFMDVLRGALSETGLDARCLSLEIAESSLGNGQRDLAKALQLLKNIGVFTTLDNFGTGGCSLARFLELRFRSVKIDRTLLSGVAANPLTSHLIRSIAAMAHDLGMEVSVSGVETEEQLEFLRSPQAKKIPGTKCDRVQGFLLGRPLCAEAVRGLLGNGNARKE